jgi:hypothetical protein
MPTWVLLAGSGALVLIGVGAGSLLRGRRGLVTARSGSLA